MKVAHLRIALAIGLSVPVLTMVLLTRAEPPVFRRISNDQVEHLGLMRADVNDQSILTREEAIAVAQKYSVEPADEAVLAWMQPDVEGHRSPKILVWAVTYRIDEREMLVGPLGVPSTAVYNLVVIDAKTGEYQVGAEAWKRIPGSTPAVEY